MSLLRIAGLILAAGSGRRMGTPKALLRDSSNTPLLVNAVQALHDGGCSSVTVVLGAASEQARGLLVDVPAEVAVASDWSEGMGASLRRGLYHPSLDGAACVVVMLVDLPDVGPEVVARLLDRVTPAEGTLARAAYDGRPGHPVLLGRDHWAGVAASAMGDRGARDYLRKHPTILVECGDLATGRDWDTPATI